ncbi:hypothetical protein ACW4FQ_28845, partial [Escherichia coli]
MRFALAMGKSSCLLSEGWNDTELLDRFTDHRHRPSPGNTMQIELLPTTAEQLPLIRNLYQFY